MAKYNLDESVRYFSSLASLYVFCLLSQFATKFLWGSPSPTGSPEFYVYGKSESTLLSSYSEYWVLSHKKKDVVLFSLPKQSFNSFFFFFFKSTELTGSWNYILAWSKSGPKESLSITPCPVEDTSAFWTSSSLEIAFPKKTESSTTNSTHISDRLYPPSKSPQNRHKETGTHMHMYTHNIP